MHQQLAAEIARSVPEMIRDCAVNNETLVSGLLDEYERQHLATCRSGWLQTYTGRAVTVMAPRPEQICIEDIAHALAYICRFNGHVNQFYSVAQHSLFVCDILPPPLALQGLLHDATEAYLGDMVKPLKRNMAEYRAAEDIMQECISRVFHVPVRLDARVKRADLIALATERRDLHRAPPMNWDIDELGIEPHPDPLCPLPPELAEEAFLQRYREIIHY